MVNLYSKITLDKIKKHCIHSKDEPLDSFKSAVMRVLGTNFKNTEIWIRNYELAGIIKIKKNKTRHWVVNWVK